MGRSFLSKLRAAPSACKSAASTPVHLAPGTEYALAPTLGTRHESWPPPQSQLRPRALPRALLCELPLWALPLWALPLRALPPEHCEGCCERCPGTRGCMPGACDCVSGSPRALCHGHSTAPRCSVGAIMLDAVDAEGSRRADGARVLVRSVRSQRRPGGASALVERAGAIHRGGRDITCPPRRRSSRSVSLPPAWFASPSLRSDASGDRLFACNDGFRRSP